MSSILLAFVCYSSSMNRCEVDTIIERGYYCCVYFFMWRAWGVEREQLIDDPAIQKYDFFFLIIFFFYYYFYLIYMILQTDRKYQKTCGMWIHILDTIALNIK